MTIENDGWRKPFLAHREPMRPTTTAVQPRLATLAPIRAVIFDLYGTLVISGSGDVGSADTSDRQTRVHAALLASGIPCKTGETPTVQQLHQQIRSVNDARRSDSCPHPEVDIVDVWRATLARTGIEPSDAWKTVRLAALFEADANPTWPMPGAKTLLKRLAANHLKLGIVSNAQFFSPILVEDLLDSKPLDAAGFDLNLCFFSNRFRQSKPGPRLFDALRDALEGCGISPYEAVYVGNDMLNDVWAASVAGFKTAWFAGDGRSCRRRQDDPRCRSLEPDLVLTDLSQLPGCLQIR